MEGLVDAAMSKGAPTGLRCWRCRLLAPMCVCAEMPRFEHATKLALVLHRNEANKPTNTGHLATRCLSGSRTFLAGGGRESLELALPGRVAVLFPSDDAVDLTPATAPDVLIVPDGTWPQAKRLVKREPALKDLPRVKLTHAVAAGPRIRHVDRIDGLMTLEAIGAAYGAMGAPHIEQALLALFRLVAERTLFMRGKLGADAVSGGVPDAVYTENNSAKWKGDVTLRFRRRVSRT